MVHVGIGSVSIRLRHEATMAAVETRSEKNSSPIFWRFVWGWMQSIPRAAILSLVGPLILLLVGYLGWRYYGAKALDSTFYAVKPENIHMTNTPAWLKTDIVREVFEGSNLGRMSLLDDQTAAVIARAFDAHPWIRKTYRVQKMAGGQILVNVEYRNPIAMVHCETDSSEVSDGGAKESFLPIDAEGVLLPTKDFAQADIPNYMLIYARNIRASDHRRVGTPLGDSQVAEAVLLARELLPLREETNVVALYVYPTRSSGKAKWMLELATRGGPRIIWGSAPGLEARDEPSLPWKIKRLREITSQRELWSQPEFDLSHPADSSTEPKPPAKLSRRL
ncbi:MAG: hypothetical protein KGQ51_06545 [Planctomycetes bacterium]|nr:hypothetical protein [Planctomycetota bacterium]